MSALKISKTKDYFIKDNKPYFYFADTVWSAFYLISPKEWEEYLDYRRSQGFNALQISILPLGDTEKPSLHPFKVTEKGYDFFTINEDFFDRACLFLETAVSKGFQPNLVLIWVNYIRNSHVQKRDQSQYMPEEAIEPYVRYVVKRFSRFNPMYMISGDTFLESPDVTRPYLLALDTLKSLDPGALTTLHLAITHDVPQEFIQNKNLDYYMAQSSHILDQQYNTYELPTGFYRKEVKRPIVNGEPCYESHCNAGKYGRFDAFYMRRAFWQSVLSGAKAGFTYGAHGIWNWYEDGRYFHPWGGRPLDWRSAMRLPGSWDVAYCKWLFEMYELFDIEPAQDKLLFESPEVRMAASPGNDKILIYYPYNEEIRVSLDLGEYDCRLIHLASKVVSKPRLVCSKDETVIKMHGFNEDVLFVATR